MRAFLVAALALAACAGRGVQTPTTSVYPIGPFARVAHWTDVLDATPALHSEIVGGRHFYSVRGQGSAGGYPGLSEMAAAPIGPHGTWVLALPLFSGGSGGTFTVLIFEMEGRAPRFVGAISDGDRIRVRVRDGAIEEIMPGTCLECTHDIRIVRYRVTQSGLVRSGVHFSTEKEFESHSFIMGRIESVYVQAKRRYAKVRLNETGEIVIDAVSPRAELNMDRNEKRLISQVFDATLADIPPTYGNTIDRTYPYRGGFDL